MTIQLSIDRVNINAPDNWQGQAQIFQQLLQEAIRQELEAGLVSGKISLSQAVRMDIPPLQLDDGYDVQATALQVARRIVQAVGQTPESVGELR